jgi:hypothetical protein
MRCDEDLGWRLNRESATSSFDYDNDVGIRMLLMKSFVLKHLIVARISLDKTHDNNKSMPVEYLADL